MKDGGQAFPLSYEHMPQPGYRMPAHYTGMSLRDYFAGQALTGIDNWIPGGVYTTLPHDKEIQEFKAKWAYAQADAMLAEREKGP